MMTFDDDELTFRIVQYAKIYLKEVIERNDHISGGEAHNAYIRDLKSDLNAIDDFLKSNIHY